MTFFLSGGFPMVFVLVFGLVAVAGAVRFALMPVSGRIGAIVAYAASVLLVSIAGTAVDLAEVAHYVGSHPELGDDLPVVVIIGISESLSPVILGFSLAGLAALISAVGLRRLPA